jgi:hypothetical protein
MRCLSFKRTFWHFPIQTLSKTIEISDALFVLRDRVKQQPAADIPMQNDPAITVKLARKGSGRRSCGQLLPQVISKSHGISQLSNFDRDIGRIAALDSMARDQIVLACADCSTRSYVGRWN